MRYTIFPRSHSTRLSIASSGIIKALEETCRKSNELKTAAARDPLRLEVDERIKAAS